MIKNNNRGFTLVELLATVSILAVLMIIAVPNIINMIERNKNTTYVEDARKLVLLAKHEFSSNENIHRPTINSSGQPSCTVLRFSYLIRNSEIDKGPEGGNYNYVGTYAGSNDYGALSYVIIKYNPLDKIYEYGVQLVEEYTSNDKTIRKGVKFISDSSKLTEENAFNKYVYMDKNLNDFYGHKKLSTNCYQIYTY